MICNIGDPMSLRHPVPWLSAQSVHKEYIARDMSGPIATVEFSTSFVPWLNQDLDRDSMQNVCIDSNFLEAFLDQLPPLSSWLY